uniref:Uncharacterized protein n=1 Tax=Tanacetum cinerariifolium TaxID=118510 RepID=A0A6L2KRG0_TANCI|nr:hypothetical protein [Tanacetum cinerariifolium]
MQPQTASQVVGALSPVLRATLLLNPPRLRKEALVDQHDVLSDSNELYDLEAQVDAELNSEPYDEKAQSGEELSSEPYDEESQAVHEAKVELS